MLPRPHKILTIAMLFVPNLAVRAATEFQVINNGSSSYLIDAQNNPDITLQRDSTYIFHISAPGHPFWIKTAKSTGTGNAYNVGVTGNGTWQGDVQFTVPSDAPDQLFYNCQFHSPMTGTITIEGPLGGASPLEQDSLALVALYDSTGGANWTNSWNLNTPVSTWYGVTVSGGRMTILTLQSNQLNGSIPPELGNLDSLTLLYLNDNQLTGSIPVELGDLANLTGLFLYSNELSGLPDLSALTALKFLLVQNNRLTFEDLEPNMGVPSTTFNYAPQDSVGSERDTTLPHAASLDLSVEVGGTANIYQWVKDGADIPGATGDTLSISPVTNPDHGSYIVRVTNTLVTGLTLYSRPIHVTVINIAPQLVAIPDTTIQEDDTLRIVLQATDVDGDPLTWSAASDTSAVATSVSDSLLSIIPDPNWNGVATVFVSVSDGQATVSDTITVTVTPVDDPPQPFMLLIPRADSVLIVTASMIGDSVKFVWESSFDADGDTLNYFFVLTYEGAFGDSVGPLMTRDTSIYLQIDSMMVADAITGGVTEIVSIWDVVADDGEKSILATDFNRIFTLKFANELLALGDRLGVPLSFALHQNYPNPFNPTSTIRFDLPKTSEVSLIIYDLMGREVVRLMEGTLGAGYHTRVWDARDSFGRVTPSGIYITRLVTPAYTMSIKMVLLK